MSDDWENIPGFDRIKRKYIRLDADAWLAAHSVQAEGKQRGKRDQPGTDETLPDQMYRGIESWVQKRALACKEEVSKYIQDELASLHDLRSHWENENPEIDLDVLVTRSCQDLDATATQSVGALDKQRAEFEEATRDLSRFRHEHGLSDIAHYPANQFAHWLWVPVFMIIETFAGAVLLGSVSRGGVIEGWMVAVVLTVVNVILGVFCGRMWRFTNYRWGFVRFLAYVLSAVCALLALAWNDIAGHVRDVYVLAEKTGAFETLDGAFATGWITMWERPLPWESLPSAGLALVGFFVFCLTAYKSYAADDPFPGYGAKHRKERDLRYSYQDDMEDALNRLKSQRNDAKAAIDEIKSRYEMDQAGWKAALDRLTMVVDDYPVNLRQYNKDLAYLLAAYRDANLSTRKTPPPSFFGHEPTIDEDVVQVPRFMIPDAPEWGDIEKKAEAGFQQVGTTYGQLITRYQTLDGIVDDYAEDRS